MIDRSIDLLVDGWMDGFVHRFVSWSVGEGWLGGYKSESVVIMGVR